MEGNKGPRVRLQQSICPDTLGVQDQGSHGNIEFFLGEITAARKTQDSPAVIYSSSLYYYFLLSVEANATAE